MSSSIPAYDAYAPLLSVTQPMLPQTDPYAAYTSPSFSPATVNPLTYSPAYSGGSLGDEIRTIFITGFPPDVKERELNNLLRFLHGYKASQMNWKNGQAQGFALFESNLQARQAVESITQLVFDDSYILRCEMARKNMYIKEDAFAAAAKRQQIYPAQYLYGMDGYAAAAAPVRPQAYGQVTNVRDNPPCNTLFIGNLSDNVDETELRTLFTQQPGFRQMKLVHGEKGTNCFVEFIDIPSAGRVHQTQQGAILASSDRGPIRIQYSKNPFGKKRDFGMQMYDYMMAAGGMMNTGGLMSAPIVPPQYFSTSPRIDVPNFQSGPLPMPVPVADVTQ
eukprot:TRINITY_DN545_c0_g1_i1.p1 TRINITY_DN545_c0_g1~~TRINITY_DN545_c0_g1_i1.p1  ORF type:complete len:334 (-),score=56.16 TRINITY_DN545_c0_g1_i1:3544-4545(-)